MPRDKIDPEKSFPRERVQGDWRLTVVMSWSIIVTGWYCSVCCNRLQAWKSLENNLFKKDAAQIMVLFCLNQIGNHIPNPFSHSAMWLPHSIKAAHNLRQRRGPARWHLFQGNGCTSDSRDLGEETFASWEVSTEAIPLGACVWEWSWHVVAGIQSIFENRWMGENASPSLLTPTLSSPLSSPFKFCLVPWQVSVYSQQRKKWDWEPHWNLTGVWCLFRCPICVETWLFCPYLPPPQTICSWEPHEKVHPGSRFIRQALFCFSDFTSIFSLYF